MSGVHQIKEQNEKITALLEERPAAEHPADESATAAADTQAGEEEDNARSH